MSIEGQDRLLHSWRNGQAKHAATLDDYAHLCRAALALHEATGAGTYLAQARRWVETLDRHYWDGANGGYTQAAIGLKAGPALAAPIPG